MRYRNYFFYLGMAAVVLFGLACGTRVLAQATGTGSIHGNVTDPSGGAVPGASVQVTTPDGQMVAATVDANGAYDIRNLAPGKYTVDVTFSGFTPYKKESIDVAAGQAVLLNVSLAVAGQTQQVTVSGEALSLDTTPSNNASAVVLSQKEIDALPDDPDELQADLEALAGPSAGPNGGQMYIDGFTAGQLPPKSSILEIRINSNPFSAEYDRPGFGRIEIFTRAGANAWHGSTSVNRNQAAFNSRNPFVDSVGDFQSTQYNGNVGGSVGKKISLFFNGDFRKIDNEQVVNATILDSNFNPTNLATLAPAPQSRLNIGPRFDYQISKNNKLTVRYQYERNSQPDFGIGGFILPVQASNDLQYEHTIQVNDSQYFGTRVVYQTNFQYLRDQTSNLALNEIPSISVPAAFTGGGSGNSIDTQNHYELQSYTSIAFVKHFLKFGARLREATDQNYSNSAFLGAFQFSSLTAFQKMEQGFASGLTLPELLATPACSNVTSLSGSCGPSQYTISAGSPNAYVEMFDAGPFIQDDYKVRPNITLSYGMRFETQNHIHDHMDWAPRVAVAWGLGGSKTVPKYVVRAGWGIFYDRFAEGNILQAIREGEGGVEQAYVVPNPNFYCGPNAAGSATVVSTPCPVPTALAAVAKASTPSIYEISPDFHAPYQMQANVSVERQITKSIQLAVTYLNTRGFDQLMTANINTPVLPGTITPTPACVAPVVTNCGQYPNGIPENVFDYESVGKYRQNQLTINTTMRSGRLTLNAYYSLNYADSTAASPSNPYNVFQDYGKAAFDTRNRGFLLATIRLPYNMTFAPTINISSGAPYNVLLSKDLIGSSVFNQRPAFWNPAVNPTGANVIDTPYGAFDTVPEAGEAIVPVNYLTGPSQFRVNMRLTKTFIFGGKKPEGGGQQAQAGGPAGGPPGGGGGGGFGGGGRGGGGGGFGGGGGRGGGGGAGGVAGGRFSFTASINALNVFNNVNFAAPVGTITSPLFGDSTALAGAGPGGTSAANRLVYLQGTFNF